MTRRFTTRTAGVFAALLLASCFGDSTGPLETRRGFINIAPEFNIRGIHAVDVNRVLIRFTRPNSIVVAYDTIVPFPAADDTLDLHINVPISGSSEQFLMTILMIDDPAGDTVFQAGPTLITATAGSAPPTPTPVTFTYVGTGSKAAGVRFLATPGSVLFGDTVVFAAEAFDSNNVTIPNTPIVWSSSDTLRARVPNDSVGRIVAGIARGPVTITAALLTPPSATSPLLIQPKPNAVAVQGGSGQTGGVGSPLAQPVTVRVNAADNLGVPGVVVNFAVVTGGGTLSQAVDTTDVNGDASTTWTLGAALGAQSVSATVPAVTGGTVAIPATGVVGTPKQLAFVVQPTNVQANVAIAPAVTVAAQDTFGNTVAGFTGNITVAIGANPGSSTLGGTATVAAVAGVASFGDLTLGSLGTGYTLTAASAGLTAATSSTFDVAGGVPTQLVIVQQPSNAGAGAAIAPAITVEVRDAFNTLVTTATSTVTVAIGTNPSSGALSGTLSVAAVGGVATFSTLSIDSAGTGYTLDFASSGLTAATSSSFDISAGPATVLGFSTQPPSSAIFQSPFVTVVAARDAGGNVATSYTGAVTLGIGTNPAGGTLFGTTTVNAVAGVATFSGISVDNIGAGYTLTANATGLAGTASVGLNVVAPANANAWINPAGGNWSTASNWSLGTVPSATDTVFIRQSGTYTVNLDVGASVVRLDVGAPLGVQTLQVSANTLTMTGNGAFTVNGRLTVSGGTVNGGGTLDVFGAVTWTSGAFSGGGGTTRVNAGGALTISGTTSRTLVDYTLELAGNGVWTGTHLINSGIAGSIRVMTGGVLDIQADPTFLYNQGGTVSRLDIQGGTVLKTGTGTADMPAITNNGVVDVQSGGMAVNNGGTSNGAYTVSAGASLIFFGGAHQLTASSSVSGAGTVQMNTTVAVDGSWNVTGSTQVTGGNANFNAGGTKTTANLAVSGGALGGNAGGLLTVGTAMTWTAGNLTGSGGATRVLSGATLAISGAAGRNFTNYVLELAGNGTWTGTHQVNTGSLAILRVLAGGTLDVQGDPTYTYNQGGTASRLEVLGTLTRTTSAGVAIMNVEYDNDGQTTVSSGTLRLAFGSGAGSASGTYTVTGSATLDFAGGTHAMSGVTNGTGTVLVSGGTLTVAGGYGAATTTLTGGSANFNFPGSSTTTLTVAGGVLGGSSGSLLSVSGAMTWTTGNLTGAGGAVRVLSGGTLAISGTAGRNFTNYVLELAGNGTWTGTHQINTGSLAILRVLAGGTLDVQGDPIYNYNQGGTASRLEVLGTLTRTTSAGVALMNVEFDNDAQTTVSSGTLRLAAGSGAGTADGAYTVNVGSTLDFSAGTHALGVLSAVSGAGTVQTSGGTVNDAGTLAVTGAVSLTGGTFNYNRVAGGQTAALSVAGGTLGGNGLVTVTSLMTWTSGTLAGTGGTTRVQSGASLALSASGNFVNYILELGGTGTWSGTQQVNTGSGAILRVLPTGNLNVTGTPTLTQNQGGALTVIDNQGLFQKTAAAGTATMNVGFNSTGSMAVSAGVLALNQGGALSSPTTMGGGAFLDFTSGTFALNNGFNATGAGVVRLQGAIIVNSAVTDTARFQNLELVSGSLSHIGGVVVSGGPSTLTWSGGAFINGSGTVRIAGTMDITGTAGRNFTNGTILNQGTTNLSGTLSINTGVGAVWRNAAGATFNLTSDANLSQNQGGIQTVFDNLGTFTRSTSTGTAPWSAAFNQSGTAALNITSGVLLLNGGGVMSSGATVTSPGFLDLGAGIFTLNTGVNVTGSSFVRVVGGTITNSTVSDTARFTNLQFTSGTLNQVGGVIVGPGTFDWTGGNITGTGLVRNSGTMNITGAAGRNFTVGTLLNQGTTNWSGNLTINTGQGAVWRNAGSASFFLTGNGALSHNQGGLATFENIGSFTRNTSAGTAIIGAFYQDTAGVMNITTGTLQLSGGSRLAGTKSLTGTSVLEIPSNTLSLRGGASLSTAAGARLVLNGGILTSDSGAAGAQVNLGNVDFSAGAITHEGLMVINGAFNWTGGNITSNTAGLGGTTSMSSPGVLTISGAAGRNLTGAHTLQVGGGAVVTWTGNSNMAVGNGTIVRVQAGGVFDMQGDGIINHSQGGTATFDLQATGTLRRSVSAGVATVEPVMNKLGVIDVQTGTLLLTGGSVTNFAGTHTGAGTVELGGGTFTTTGNFTIPGNLIVSAGAFTFAGAGRTIGVTGNFTTTASGVVNMTTATDVLDINGNAVFGGGTSTLSAGQLLLAGNFTQSGSATAFAASGTHHTTLDGVALQTISFANPGAAQSRFHRLQTAATARNLSILTNVVVNDSLHMLAAGANYDILAAGATQRLTVSGILRQEASTGSPRIQVPALELSVTPVILPAVAGRGLQADTTVFLGTIPSIPVGTSIAYRYLRVNTSGIITATAPVATVNDLTVTNGTLNLNGQRITVGGNFATLGGLGILRMQAAADSLIVVGNATFDGSPGLGNLTAGAIEFRGNFTQLGTQTFATSVAHRSHFTGAANQSINFASPVNSNFHRLWLNKPIGAGQTVDLLSDVNVSDTLRFMLASELTSGGGTGNQRITAGTVRMSATSNQSDIRPRALVVNTAVAGDSTFPGAFTVRPDTLVLQGTASYTLPQANYTQFLHVRSSTSGIVDVFSNDPINGDVHVTAGRFRHTSGSHTIGGKLRVTGGGIMEMSSGAPLVVVTDSAIFSGASTAGFLTSGTLQLKGHFVNTTAAGFQASGTHITQFNGPVSVAAVAIQNLTMTSPGTAAGNSRFNRLALTRANAGSALEVMINLLSNVQAGNVVDTSQGRFDSIMGTGAVTLTTDSMQLTATLFNNVPLVVTNTGFGHTGNTVRFENMNPVTTYLSFTRTNTSISLTFSNFNFATARTGAGRYLNVTTTGVNATGTIVGFLTSTTAGTFLAANNDYTRAFSGVSTQLPLISFNTITNP